LDARKAKRLRPAFDGPHRLRPCERRDLRQLGGADDGRLNDEIHGAGGGCPVLTRRAA
jgi:hypothetical protein